MMSLFKKEASYNAGVTMNSANACELSGFDSEPADWPDELPTDEGEVTGSEQATVQEILRNKVEIAYSEPKAKPNSLTGLAALVLGNIVSVQDGGLAAYRHYITPIAWNTPLPSIQVEEKAGNQWAYTGVVGKSLKISGKQDGFISLAAQLIGSGSRVTSATGFAAKISESWLKTTQIKVWLETGANISITATPSQDVEDISSATPDDLKVRIMSFDFEWDNQNHLNYGYGSSVLQENDKGGERKASLKFSLYLDDTTILNELDYYLNQDVTAIEFDSKGALIAAGGTMYYGMSLVIPAFKIKKITRKAARGDLHSLDVDTTIINDGSNPVVKLHTYTAKAAYLAA
jgi:hypothetical protein